MSAAVHECVPGSPTAASYTWDFKAEANSIFQVLETLARQTRNDADQLQTSNRRHGVSWEIQADQLDSIKQEINDMGEKLLPAGKYTPRAGALATGRSRSHRGGRPIDGRQLARLRLCISAPMRKTCGPPTYHKYTN